MKKKLISCDDFDISDIFVEIARTVRISERALVSLTEEAYPSRQARNSGAFPDETLLP